MFIRSEEVKAMAQKKIARHHLFLPSIVCLRPELRPNCAPDTGSAPVKRDAASHLIWVQPVLLDFSRGWCHQGQAPYIFTREGAVNS